jgi:glutathione S-transferase
MNEFVIHSIPGSPLGRAVMIALEEKYAPFRLSAVSPATLPALEHLALHPFSRVPVMDHGDFRLYETQAILRYIDRSLRAPPLTPKEPKSAARMDQIMNVGDWYLCRGSLQSANAPCLTAIKPYAEPIAVAMPETQTVFSELARQLGDNDFLVGNSISLADILLAPHLDLFRETPEWAALMEKAPNLCAWLDRMNKRASLQATIWKNSRGHESICGDGVIRHRNGLNNLNESLY